MRLLCTHFDCEFRLHGREGGLNGTRWIFEPLPGDGDGGKDVRDAVQDAAAFRRDLLDRVFAGVLKGARQPALSGGEDEGCGGFAVTSGWQYAGRLTWTGRLRMRRRLERLFGEAAYPVRSGVSCGDSFHANIGLRFSGGERPPGLHLRVEHTPGGGCRLNGEEDCALSAGTAGAHCRRALSLEPTGVDGNGSG